MTAVPGCVCSDPDRLCPACRELDADLGGRLARATRMCRASTAVMAAGCYWWNPHLWVLGIGMFLWGSVLERDGLRRLHAPENQW